MTAAAIAPPLWIFGTAAAAIIPLAEWIRRATEQIQAVKGKILGVLLNDVDLDRDGYHYKYYRYYQSTSEP